MSLRVGVASRGFPAACGIFMTLGQRGEGTCGHLETLPNVIWKVIQINLASVSLISRTARYLKGQDDVSPIYHKLQTTASKSQTFARARSNDWISNTLPRRNTEC